MKIIILNLHRNTKSSQLYKLFRKFGKVESCELVMDKEKDNKSKGFGFVEMPDDDDANKAIKELNGMELDNHKIRVKVSTNTKS